MGYPWVTTGSKGCGMVMARSSQEQRRRNTTTDKAWENGGLMGFTGIYPLVMTNIAIENDH